MLITPDQIRAARGLKNWSQTELATRTGLAVPTIANIELGKQIPGKNTMERIIDAFSIGGIEFLENEGVRKNTNSIKTYRGTEGFQTFMDDLYQTADTEAGEICLFNAKPENWPKWLGDFWYDNHVKRMKEIKKKMNYKITVCEGEYNFVSKDFAKYKWVPKKFFSPKASFYVYGDKVAFINFEEDITIHSIQKNLFADGMRILFNSAWDNIAYDPEPNIKPSKKKGRK